MPWHGFTILVTSRVRRSIKNNIIIPVSKFSTARYYKHADWHVALFLTQKAFVHYQTGCCKNTRYVNKRVRVLRFAFRVSRFAFRVGCFALGVGRFAFRVSRCALSVSSRYLCIKTYLRVKIRHRILRNLPVC